jgi:hypothetical protein
VQESGSFQTTQKVPKKSDFLEKSDFSNRAGFLKPCPVSKKSDFLEKSDFSNRARCPRNPIFWKNRISQIVPGVQEIRFFGKIGFFKPCPVSKKSDFLEKSDFSNRAQTYPKFNSKYGNGLVFFWNTIVQEG